MTMRCSVHAIHMRLCLSLDSYLEISTLKSSLVHRKWREEKWSRWGCISLFILRTKTCICLLLQVKIPVQYYSVKQLSAFGNWQFPKKGDKITGFSFTSVVGKLMETIIYAKLESFLEENMMFKNTQHGFRNKCSWLTNSFIFITTHSTFMTRQSGRLTFKKRLTKSSINDY